MQTPPQRDGLDAPSAAPLGLGFKVGVVLFVLSAAIAALGFRLIADVAHDRDNLGAFLGGVFAFFATIPALAASGLFFRVRRRLAFARWFFWLPLCGPVADVLAFMAFR